MEHLSEERLLELADGALDDAHLRGCAQCRAAVEEQRTALAALRAAPLLEPPRDLVRETIAGLPPRPRERRLRGWPQRLAVLAPVAAAAIVLLVVDRGPEERAVAEKAEGDDAAALVAPADQRQSEPQLEAQAGLAVLGWTLVFATRDAAGQAAAQLEEQAFETTLEPRGDEWVVTAEAAGDEGQLSRAVDEVAERNGGRVEGTFAPGAPGATP